MKFYKDKKEKVDLLLWYFIRYVLSFVVRFMYIIGGRGYGKTYSVKSYCIERFIKKGHRFVWFRSTEAALDKIRDPEQFFGRLKNLKELGVEKYNIRKDVIYINNKIAGYLVAVSTFHNYKGADFNRCKNGVYDEFMRAKGERPVLGKRSKFFDAVESIFRDDKEARIFLISNATNQYDEMLESFNVKLKEYGIYLYRKQNALIHYVQPSKTHQENKSNSLSLIGMSEHDKKMVVENKFTDYGDYGKTNKTEYVYTLQVDDNKFISVYLGKGILYLKTTEALTKVYTCNSEYVNSKVNRLNRTSEKMLKAYYENGCMLFFDGYCRTAFQSEILKIK